MTDLDSDEDVVIKVSKKALLRQNKDLIISHDQHQNLQRQSSPVRRKPRHLIAACKDSLLSVRTLRSAKRTNVSVVSPVFKKPIRRHRIKPVENLTEQQIEQSSERVQGPCSKQSLKSLRNRTQRFTRISKNVAKKQALALMNGVVKSPVQACHERYPRRIPGGHHLQVFLALKSLIHSLTLLYSNNLDKRNSVCFRKVFQLSLLDESSLYRDGFLWQMIIVSPESVALRRESPLKSVTLYRLLLYCQDSIVKRQICCC